MVPLMSYIPKTVRLRESLPEKKWIYILFVKRLSMMCFECVAAISIRVRCVWVTGVSCKIGFDNFAY